MSKIKRMYKKMFPHAGKEFFRFSVIDGQDFLPGIKLSSYLMMGESKDYGKGVVDIEGKLYYLLGITRQEEYQKGKQRTVSGAIVGRMLFGTAGAIIGSQTRKKDKDISTYIIELADYNSKKRFKVEAEGVSKYSKSIYKRFKPVNPEEIGIEE